MTAPQQQKLRVKGPVVITGPVVSGVTRGVDNFTSAICSTEASPLLAVTWRR